MAQSPYGGVDGAAAVRASHRKGDVRRIESAGASAIGFGSVVLDLDHLGVVTAAHGQLAARPAKSGELVGQQLINLLHAEDRPALKSVLELVVPGGPARRLDCRVCRPAALPDSWRWMELTVTREGSTSRGAGGWQVAMNDATRARAAEQQLRETQALLSALLSHIPAAVSVRDPEGRLLSVNREFARVVGGHPEVLLGRHRCRPSRRIRPGAASSRKG